VDYWFKAIRKYGVFRGRACRKEYWMFFLFNLIFQAVAIALDNALGIVFVKGRIYGPIYVLYSLFILIPGLAITVRRFHDTDHSGWWLLLALIPLVNLIFGIIFLIWLIRDGTPGENKYGPNPKEVGEC